MRQDNKKYDKNKTVHQKVARRKAPVESWKKTQQGRQGGKNHRRREANREETARQEAAAHHEAACQVAAR